LPGGRPGGDPHHLDARPPRRCHLTSSFARICV
jgi:hypothetical protein